MSLLHRLLPKLWRAFPGARLRVRLDAGFATPEIFDHLEAAGVEYVVAMAKNAVLARHAEPSVAPLRAVVATTQDTATTYAEAAYQAGTWAAPRRTIIKAEVVWHQGREPRDNPRFVITNLRQTPEWIYTHVYCARGDSENRLKELKHALAFGRTSCTRFWANQLRITLTAAAFVLCQELQLACGVVLLTRAHCNQIMRLGLCSTNELTSTTPIATAGEVPMISRRTILVGSVAGGAAVALRRAARSWPPLPNDRRP